MKEPSVDLHVHISTPLYEQVKKIARSRGLSLRSIVRSALEQQFLDSTKDDTQSLTARLARVERGMKGLRSDNEVLLEVLAQFIYQWFCHTPVLPENYKDSIVKEATERYERFSGIIRKRVESSEFKRSSLLVREKEPSPSASADKDHTS